MQISAASSVREPEAALAQPAPRYWALIVVIALAMLFAISVKAQSQSESSTQSQTPAQTQTAPTAPSEGKTLGNYSVEQSVEFGYRDSMIHGNLNNYNTFENLGTGFRLFDYTLNMRSIDHRGLFFDNLNFSNFGYGGDPNDVTRLRANKDKWYDFRLLFRRDKNFWDYNLLANPLNTAAFPTPQPIANSPHALYLTRRMQDYDLTLFPQSRLRFRVGYSHDFNGGPAFTTYHGTADTVLDNNYRTSTNGYRFGVDYTDLTRTTISFDEFLTYTKIDNSIHDQNFLFQLANGTPVDLGINFQGTTPCAKPVTNATTNPPMVTANCNGYISYAQIQNPRSSFPTERLSFQSDYIKNLSMSGSAGYSSGTNTVLDLSEILNGWSSRTLNRGNTTAGPESAKRISAQASWAGDYRMTDKLHVTDEFLYDNWRIPGTWTELLTNIYPAAQQATTLGLSLVASTVTPANFAVTCPVAPYNQAGCPEHSSSSLADFENELHSEFLAQKLKSNLIEAKYDFSRRYSARVGYFCRARTIAQFAETTDVSEIYFPGGPTGSTPGNLFLTARADCALVGGVLPADCTKNANGTVTEVGPEAGNDTERNLTEIHERGAVVGFSARPTSQLRLNADLLFGSNDNSFTRVSPRQVQSYKIQAGYTPTAWATINGAVDIHENRDNVTTINNLEHGRTYSFSTTLARSEKFWVDFGYSYWDVFTQTEICFPEPGSLIFTAACPIAGSPGPLGTLSMYSSKDHFAYGNVMWKPIKRVTAMLGYSGSIVRGNTTLLSPVAPTGTLDFNYLRPSASLAIDLYKGLSYKTAWNYYGYNDKGIQNPVGLAALPLQDFNGNNVTFSMRYVF
jgi:hypothetical protein